MDAMFVAFFFLLLCNDSRHIAAPHSSSFEREHRSEGNIYSTPYHFVFVFFDVRCVFVSALSPSFDGWRGDGEYRYYSSCRRCRSLPCFSRTLLLRSTHVCLPVVDLRGKLKICVPPFYNRYWLLRSLKDPIVGTTIGIDRIPICKFLSLVVVFALVSNDFRFSRSGAAVETAVFRRGRGLHLRHGLLCYCSHGTPRGTHHHITTCYPSRKRSCCVDNVHSFRNEIPPATSCVHCSPSPVQSLLALHRASEPGIRWHRCRR